MKKLTSKWKIMLYALSGLGVNMLNLIVTSYLCDALMTEGFDANIENWTYFNKTLVVAGIWSVSIFVAKILDGIIDIPFSVMGENVKSRFGKRRPTILVGLILTLLSYLMFLNPINRDSATIANTIYLAFALCSFYAFYTLTMVTFYATFSEIVDNSKDRLFLSNCKSTFDVMYFIFGYALIPALIGSTNIRIIAYIFMPLALTMLIPMFLIKEPSTLDRSETEKAKPLKITTAVACAFKNKAFLKWMGVYCILQFGVQIFLTGQNVYCSGVAKFDGLRLSILNACSFAPVPFTLMLYNHIIKKKGFIKGFSFALGMFVIGMTLLCLCNPVIISDMSIRTVVGVCSALFCSFGIGAFFSVEYVIPSTLAAKEYEKTKVSNSGMYFAVQGVVGGIISGVATGLVWVNLKDSGYTWLMGIIVASTSLLTILGMFTLPKVIDNIGKAE